MKGFFKVFLGHALFAAVSVAVLFFCAWIKSWWDEPLGYDGLALWMALLYPVHKAWPIVEKRIFSTEKKSRP